MIISTGCPKMGIKDTKKRKCQFHARNGAQNINQRKILWTITHSPPGAHSTQFPFEYLFYFLCNKSFYFCVVDEEEESRIVLKQTLVMRSNPRKEKLSIFVAK